MTRCAGVMLTGLLLAGTAWAAPTLRVETGPKVTLGKVAQDVAVSADGSRVFVLQKGGEIQVLTPNGELLERFSLGLEGEHLAISPEGERLFVTAGGELHIVNVTAVQALPVLNSPVKGNENAPVTLTVFSDFQCPYCSRLVPLLDELLIKNPAKVRIVFKQFPLRMHNMAMPAALASLAAREQGQFWPLHDLLFINFNQLSEERIRALAREAGLDLARFDRDRSSPALRDEVQRDLALGQQAGVQGTPVIFLNGTVLRERSVSAVQAIIDREAGRVKGEGPR